MNKLHEYVRAFMMAGDQPVADRPGVPEDGPLGLGLSLIYEELAELTRAVKAAQRNPDAAQLALVADALGDLLYVVTWNGLAWGFPMPQIVDEIQRANMAKFGPGSRKRADGKVLKPPDWKPPDILQFVENCNANK